MLLLSKKTQNLLEHYHFENEIIYKIKGKVLW